uniref:type I polyketide synthase n=1 Tax=Amycolatopsis sp. lyj-90 TaxID=2789285 RepID=UPI00397E46B1
YGTISNQLGTQTLGHLLTTKQTGVVCVSPIDWDTYVSTTPLTSDFVSQQSQQPQQAADSGETRGHADREIYALVRKAVSEAIGRSLEDDDPLMANGLDSLSAVLLAQDIGRALGTTLSSTFVLNHPSIEEMSEGLLALQLESPNAPAPVAAASGPVAHPVEPPAATPLLDVRPAVARQADSAVVESVVEVGPAEVSGSGVAEPIAVVGSACRLPGAVGSPGEFWEMLRSGVDGVGEVPVSRFDIGEVFDPNPDAVGRSYTRRGAFMDDVEHFDNEFFGILASEARAMDPQQRVLLEVAYEAFHCAGYNKKILRNSNFGVYVGVANQDWTIVTGDEGASNPFFGAGVSGSIMSNRVSYCLGLTGPSMTVDTACSSSLVAIDLAVEKLRTGACSAALVGGVNVMTHHRTYVGCCSAKMLSFEGRCATFDESADGYCRGEGVGAVVLKRLCDAEADGDQVLAVIRGTAVNQDGRSASLTAPNGLAQEAVIGRALAEAGVRGGDVDFVECHGTGTPLGDPIEVEALRNVLGVDRVKPVVLGAVKSNIGHLEGAAGIVGLIKAIEVLRHREAPGNLHFTALNPKIDLSAFDAIIPTKSTPLAPTGKLIAGVSSFGFGGTNAHVVLESYDQPHHTPPPARVEYARTHLPWRRLPSTASAVVESVVEVGPAEVSGSGVAEPIAVVGSACRLPGAVGSPGEFWEMLRSGVDGVGEVPVSRFDIGEVFDPNPDAVGRSYTRRGAFMDDVDHFDNEFFGIPINEAQVMDPQQRMLLEVAYEAFHYAGYDKKKLRNSKIGVYVGQMNHDWSHMMDARHLTDPFFGAGASGSIMSNRVSYCLGLTGPSMTVDTACSSSLVAIDLAVEKLRTGACSAALVGGVNVMLSARSFIGGCSAKMLSFEGRCATFDESADGYCRGEGVGAVVLKRLCDAEADGDQVLAVIRGTAVNQDGRSASLTAPNGLAQEAVIGRALAEAGVRGGDVDFVECHGTGTPLGDPIEVEALRNVLGVGRVKPVVLGAVKSNIGHLEGAAGIVGLIKAIEVLRHREAPGNLHFTALNPKIDLSAFDAIIPTKSTPLAPTGKLIAGVSSFGFGGTNAHVVLESYDQPHHTPPPAR